MGKNKGNRKNFKRMGCMLMVSKIFDFKFMPIKEIYNNDSFKVYAGDIESDKHDCIIKNSHGNVSVFGTMPDLNLGALYDLTCEETDGKYGIGYKFISMKETIVPTDADSLRTFLLTVGVTPPQVKEIVREYPNIIELFQTGKDSEIDLTKLYNIGPDRIRCIKEKVMENLELFSVVDIFKGTLSYRIADMLHTKYKSKTKIIEEFKKDPYRCLRRLDRIAFKTADAILLNMARTFEESDPKTLLVTLPKNLISSEFRCIAAVLFVLEENELQGNTCMKIDVLKKELLKIALECSHYFSPDWNYLAKDSSEKEIKLLKDFSLIARKKTFETEQYIAEKILYSQKWEHKTCWYIDTERYRQLDGFELTDEQINTLNLVCENQVTILNGPGGTGKSSSVLALINMLRDNNKMFSIAAPTGRAAKVISEYTKSQASTIHRLLQYGAEGFAKNEKNQLVSDIVIIDETSMCDVFLFKSLIESIDLTKTKLLLIGDSAQLPSVGAGNILYDLINSGKIPLNSLSKVFRMGKGGVLTAATYVRNQKPFLNNMYEVQSIGADKNYKFITTPDENIVDNVTNLYSKLIGAGYSPSDILVLSSYNKGNYGTIAINNELQKTVNRYSLKPFNNPNIIITSDKTVIKFFEKDLVLQTKNNYNAYPVVDYNNLKYPIIDENITTFVPNGEIGIVKKIYDTDKSAIIKFSGEDILYESSDMNNLKLAYSITTHKSQGGSAKVIIFVTPKNHAFMLNSNLLYVGITRATDKVFQIGDIYAVNNAIRKKADLRRLTALPILLAKEENKNGN